MGFVWMEFHCVVFLSLTDTQFVDISFIWICNNSVDWRENYREVGQFKQIIWRNVLCFWKVT